MKSVHEVATVHCLDYEQVQVKIDVASVEAEQFGRTGAAGIDSATYISRSRRAFDADWATAVAAALAAAPRDGVQRWLRFEWVGAGEEWLDVIGEGPGGLVRLRLHPGGDGPQVTGVEVRAAPGGQIGTRALRRFGLADFKEHVDWALQEAGEHQGREETFGVRLAGGELAAIGSGKWCRRIRRPGRAGRSDLFYAVWAQRYLAAIESDPGAPIKFLVNAEKAAGRHVTEAGVKAIVNKARRTRRLLTGAPPGQPGGELTPDAKKLLGLD